MRRIPTAAEWIRSCDPRSRNYGPAGFNRAQVFTANFYYSLPKPGKITGFRPLGWVADNWELSGVARVLTGAPITPGYSLITGITTPTGTPTEGAGWKSSTRRRRWRQRFGPPPEPAGQASLANAALVVHQHRSAVRQPGPEHHDRSGNQQLGSLDLPRDSDHGSGLKLMLRLETYNTFNHTQFSGINSTAQFNTRGHR